MNTIPRPPGGGPLADQVDRLRRDTMYGELVTDELATALEAAGKPDAALPPFALAQSAPASASPLTRAVIMARSYHFATAVGKALQTRVPPVPSEASPDPLYGEFPVDGATLVYEELVNSGGQWRATLLTQITSPPPKPAKPKTPSASASAKPKTPSAKPRTPRKSVAK